MDSVRLAELILGMSRRVATAVQSALAIHGNYYLRGLRVNVVAVNRQESLSVASISLVGVKNTLV